MARKEGCPGNQVVRFWNNKPQIIPLCVQQLLSGLEGASEGLGENHLKILQTCTCVICAFCGQMVRSHDARCCCSWVGPSGMGVAPTHDARCQSYTHSSPVRSALVYPLTLSLYPPCPRPRHRLHRSGHGPPPSAHSDDEYRRCSDLQERLKRF